MIPILYDTNETAFISNGLGRLRDCISCVVTEERNGIYECDFEYPITGAHYNEITLGMVVGITHDDTGDVEPFDIVSYSKPINGVVTFHCVHISYRLSYMTVTASNINSLADAFTAFASAEPSMPFIFQTDKASTGFVAGFDGLPHTVKSLMGGTEGSLLDTYGGEYSFNNWGVYLHAARGQMRDFTIRYGVNMLEFNDETDSSGTFSSCIPYWTNGDTKIIGNRVDSPGVTVTGRGECVPLDLSDKFQDSPTTAQLESYALDVMNDKSTYLPTQTINVSFIRLQDMEEYAGFSNLLKCGLCDTIKVIFPDYNMSGNFKIVKTVWDVLMDRYTEMELGTLSTTLAEALGLTGDLSADGSSGAHVIIEQGADANGWAYKKYSDGSFEAVRARDIGQYTISTTEVSPIKVGNTVTSNLPGAAISGDIEVSLMGNSSNSPCWLERISPTEWRIAKATTGNVTLQHMTVCERTIGAKWK